MYMNVTAGSSGIRRNLSLLMRTYTGTTPASWQTKVLSSSRQPVRSPCMQCTCHKGMNVSGVKCIEVTSGTSGYSIDNTAHKLCSTYLSISSQRWMPHKNSSCLRLRWDLRFRITFGPVSRSQVWPNGGNDFQVGPVVGSDDSCLEGVHNRVLFSGNYLVTGLSGIWRPTLSLSSRETNSPDQVIWIRISVGAGSSWPL